MVFEAKKYAEAALGVGKAIEVVMVDQNGVKRIDKNVIRSLEKVYDEKVKLTSQVIKEKIEPLLSEINLS